MKVCSHCKVVYDTEYDYCSICGTVLAAHELKEVDIINLGRCKDCKYYDWTPEAGDDQGDCENNKAVSMMHKWFQTFTVDFLGNNESVLSDGKTTDPEFGCIFWRERVKN